MFTNNYQHTYEKMLEEKPAFNLYDLVVSIKED